MVSLGGCHLLGESSRIKWCNGLSSSVGDGGSRRRERAHLLFRCLVGLGSWTGGFEGLNAQVALVRNLSLPESEGPRSSQGRPGRAERSEPRSGALDGDGGAKLRSLGPIGPARPVDRGAWAGGLRRLVRLGTSCSV